LIKVKYLEEVLQCHLVLLLVFLLVFLVILMMDKTVMDKMAEEMLTKYLWWEQMVEVEDKAVVVATIKDPKEEFRLDNQETKDRQFWLQDLLLSNLYHSKHCSKEILKLQEDQQAREMEAEEEVAVVVAVKMVATVVTIVVAIEVAAIVVLDPLVVSVPVVIIAIVTRKALQIDNPLDMFLHPSQLGLEI
jgi:hypothetical protein